ncbi:MAG: cyclic nucleotide-binding domain-containing protein [Fimbriimonadaceae bacterium]|nr:cyclic nucleotide-binding domain-containing protein [Fimbriimonadaceae bacterium]
MLTATRLTDYALFRGLPDHLLPAVESLARVEQYQADQVIFRENEAATDIFLLHRGLVGLSFTFLHAGQELHVQIKQVQPGEVFGWSALTRQQRLSAQAVAVGPAEVLRIPAAPLRELMEATPQLGYRVMDHLTDLASQRLHSTRDHLRALLGW